jgi:hypothetical protein
VLDPAGAHRSAGCFTVFSLSASNAVANRQLRLEFLLQEADVMYLRSGGKDGEDVRARISGPKEESMGLGPITQCRSGHDTLCRKESLPSCSRPAFQRKTLCRLAWDGR